jgi:hypothetical protein
MFNIQQTFLELAVFLENKMNLFLGKQNRIEHTNSSENM